MKHTSMTLLSLLFMLLLCGCIEDSFDSSAQELVPISLTTVAPSDVSTRTISTDIQSSQLASGQVFYAYFPSGTTQASGGSALTNTTFTANGSGGTTPAITPYFTFAGTDTDVRAYYPSTVTEGTTSFTVEADQSGDDAYRASDLMFASANITKVSPVSTGALTFAHKMAKIRINATVNAGVSVQSIKLKNIKRQIAFAPATGAVSSPTAVSGNDVTLFTSAGQTANFSCVALIPPQEFTASTNLIAVTTANHTLVYTLPSNVTFESNNQYVYNVSIFDSRITVTTNITNWDSSPAAQNGQGTLNRPRLPIEYIAPYNMQTATTMATDNLISHSMYFCWNTSNSTQTPKANIQKMINGTAVAGYHLPSKAEWCAVMAPYYGNAQDSNMGGADGVRIVYKRGVISYNLSETVGWGVTNNNTSSTYTTANYSFDVLRTFYNDYYCPNDADHTYIGYALRFKELSGGNYVNGQYTCAYRYEYKTSDATVGGYKSLTIKVKYVGADTGITISTISTESWWTSPEFTVVLPAGGYSPGTNCCDQSPSFYSSTTSPGSGFYWSSSLATSPNMYRIGFAGANVDGNGSAPAGYGFYVRLFKDK